MPIIPSSGSSTSPVPEIIKLFSLSAIAIRASNLLKYLSVRQSFANSTAALVRFPACFSNFDSSLSKRVNASAVDPAKPAITFLFSILRTLFERLEGKLEKHAGNLTRAAVELAKDWRTDKYLRRLEALMAIADKEKSFIISGTGDVLEPEEGIIGIGSGGNYALAAAKVLMDSKMSAEEIAKKSIQVASEICVFTNNNITLEKI